MVLSKRDNTCNLSTTPMLVKGTLLVLLVLQGNKEGLRKLKLKIEDPPRRKHTGNRSTAYAHESRLLTIPSNWTAVTHAMCTHTQRCSVAQGPLLASVYSTARTTPLAFIKPSLHDTSRWHAGSLCLAILCCSLSRWSCTGRHHER